MEQDNTKIIDQSEYKKHERIRKIVEKHNISMSHYKNKKKIMVVQINECGRLPSNLQSTIKGENCKMKKIMIFYHSGAGATKMIGEIFKEKLSESFEVEIKRVDNNYEFESIKNIDFLIFGFPVYGFEASPSMKEFIDNIPVFDKPIKCFLYSTLGFVSGNSIRKISKKLYQKNIVTTNSVQFFSPASDGALIFPASWKWARSFKNKTSDKIKISILEIKKAINSPDFKLKIPFNKFYWSFMEKLLLIPILKQERKFINSLHIGEERCNNCSYCVTICKRGCIKKGENYPTFKAENCEFCLGCVHHCPNKAITFLKKYLDRPRLNEKFFEEQKTKLLNKLSDNVE